MDPIRARLQATPASGGLNVSAIANSVIRMRLATVGLDSGRLRWIDNAGNLLDAAGQPVAGAASIPLTEGVLASAAIPVVFDPVTLNGERFTDGGVRQFVPIQAAGIPAQIRSSRSSPLSRGRRLLRAEPSLERAFSISRRGRRT